MAFKRSMTVYELILNEILRSFVQIAKLKDEELDDHADRFELFRMNDQAFQSIVSRSMNNVFKKIIDLNMEKIKSKDMLLYLRLKYIKTVEVMEIENEVERCIYKDRTTGKLKAKCIDHIDNLRKAE